MKNIFLSRGWIILQATFKKIHVNEDENINNDDIWGRSLFAVFMKNYAEQQE